MMGKVIHNERLSASAICGESQFADGGNLGVLTAGIDLSFNLSSELIDGIYLLTLIVGDQAVGESLLIQH